MKYGENVILAFTKYEKTADLMKETGLSRNTIKRYKADPELRKIVQERRSEMISAAVALMQDYLTDGVQELIKIIKDPETPAQTKVNAINLIFNQCRDWMTTTDLQKRLEVLEDAERAILDDFRG